MKPTSCLISAALATLLAATVPATLEAFAQEGSRPRSGAVDLQQARNLVNDLPEVQVWQEARREEAKQRKDGQSTGGMLVSARDVKGVKHWAVTLYQDPQTAPKKWAVFLVRAKDGRVFVEQDGGRMIPLEDWRKTRPAT